MGIASDVTRRDYLTENSDSLALVVFLTPLLQGCLKCGSTL